MAAIICTGCQTLLLLDDWQLVSGPPRCSKCHMLLPDAVGPLSSKDFDRLVGRIRQKKYGGRAAGPTGPRKLTERLLLPPILNLGR